MKEVSGTLPRRRLPKGFAPTQCNDELTKVSGGMPGTPFPPSALEVHALPGSVHKPYPPGP